MENFMRLHIHSVMSTRDAMLKIEDIIEDSQAAGDGFAITDHGSIAGWIELHNQCKKKGIKPVFGIEAYANKHRERLFEVIEELTKSGLDPERIEELKTERDSIKKNEHILILAKNQAGFHNIIELNNLGFIDGFYNRPTITYDELYKHREGLIVTTACIGGRTGQFILKENVGAADEFCELMKEWFADDFYLELQVNRIPEQMVVNRELIKMSDRLGIKMCLGSDAHYRRPEWQSTHQDLLLLQSKKLRSDVGKFDMHIEFENGKGEKKSRKLGRDKEYRKGVLAGDVKVGQCYDLLKSGAMGKNSIVITNVKEVARAWEFPGDAALLTQEETLAYADTHHPECVPYMERIMQGNVEIYSKIENISIDSDIKLPVVDDADKILVDKVKAALVLHNWHGKRLYVDRVKHELKTIKDNGFSSYFLIVADFIEYAKNQEIPVGVGRGSVVSSLVAFLLGIHRVDPMLEKWNGMPFERFLSTSKFEKKILIYDEAGNKKEFTSNDVVEVRRNNIILHDCLAKDMIEGDEFIKVVKRNII